MSAEQFRNAVFLLAVCMNESAIAASQNSPAECGVNALYVAMHTLNQDCQTNLDFLRHELSPDSEGNTLEELQAVAIRSGFEAISVATTLEALQFRERPFCCIAHLQSGTGHFVLLTDIQGDLVSVADPPMSAEIPRSTFLSEWTGNALILGVGPLQDEEKVQRLVQWHRFSSMAIRGLVVLALIGLAYWLVRHAWRWRSAYSRVSRGGRHVTVLLVSFCLMNSGCGETAARSQTTKDQDYIVDGNVSSGLVTATRKNSNNFTSNIVVEPTNVDLGELLIRSERYETEFTVRNVSQNSIRLNEISTTVVAQ